MPGLSDRIYGKDVSSALLMVETHISILITKEALLPYKGGSASFV